MLPIKIETETVLSFKGGFHFRRAVTKTMQTKCIEMFVMDM